MDFQFKRNRIDKIPKEKIISELEKVAQHFGYKDFTGDEFNKISDISTGTVLREFGTWEKSIDFLKDHLKQRNIDFGKRRNRRQYSEKELFEEMERIWKEVGHRPSSNEWKACNPKISDNTYMRYFGGWQNACLKFIEYKMGGSILSDDENRDEVEVAESQNKTSATENKFKPENTRTIPLNVRLKVLNRDNFKCVFCGRSPATDIGVQLHIDHIEPFSLGGKSTYENLQTLCQECNLGKSNKMIINGVN